jgi:hypothetical protein
MYKRSSFPLEWAHGYWLPCRRTVRLEVMAGRSLALHAYSVRNFFVEYMPSISSGLFFAALMLGVVGLLFALLTVALSRNVPRTAIWICFISSC